MHFRGDHRLWSASSRDVRRIRTVGGDAGRRRSTKRIPESRAAAEEATGKYYACTRTGKEEGHVEDGGLRDLCQPWYMMHFAPMTTIAHRYSARPTLLTRSQSCWGTLLGFGRSTVSATDRPVSFRGTKLVLNLHFILLVLVQCSLRSFQ